MSIHFILGHYDLANLWWRFRQCFSLQSALSVTVVVVGPSPTYLILTGGADSNATTFLSSWSGTTVNNVPLDYHFGCGACFRAEEWLMLIDHWMTSIAIISVVSGGSKKKRALFTLTTNGIYFNEDTPLTKFTLAATFAREFVLRTQYNCWSLLRRWKRLGCGKRAADCTPNIEGAWFWFAFDAVIDEITSKGCCKFLNFRDSNIAVCSLFQFWVRISSTQTMKLKNAQHNS
mgnify:CR=1 FL=1